MNERNWIDLSRKLVDRFDLDYSFSAVQEIVAKYALASFGEGVLVTTTYPNPFPITMSNSVLGGSVGNGIAYDPNGQITSIDPGTATSTNFTLAAADAVLPRWDLLCIRYVQKGNTPVPKPSDPLTTIFLNLGDDFQLVVITGIPSITPAYPAKGVLDIILTGLQIPATSVIGTQITVDLSIRERGLNNLASYPVFHQETPTGIINNSNVTFAISLSPVNNQSVLLKQDGTVLSQGIDYSINNQTITMFTAPAPGQSLSVFYVVNSGSSANPVSGYQEIPTGTPNGILDTFTLTGNPQNQYSTLVFVNGLSLDSSEWSLQQSTSVSAIRFMSGSIPEVGQSVYVFYLISVQNPLVITVAGSGSLTAVGNRNSPQVVTASGGVSPLTTPRQVIYVTSTGGAVTITANPQIDPGTFVGQELYLVGVSDTDYIILNDGNGLIQNGSSLLKGNESILYIWNGTSWGEVSRT